MRSFALAAALALGLALPATQAGAVEGKLVLYTSQPNTDAQQTIDAFKAKYPKVEISFVRDGTPRVMAKLRAEFEAGAPQNAASATGSEAASGASATGASGDATAELLSLLQGATGARAGADAVRAQMMDLLLKLQEADGADAAAA